MVGIVNCLLLKTSGLHKSYGPLHGLVYGGYDFMERNGSHNQRKLHEVIEIVSV